VTTDAVAQRAEVSKTSIYRRWHTKSDLVVAAIEEVIRPVTIPDLGSFAAEVRYLLDIRMQQWADPSNALVLQAFIGAAASDEVIRRSFESWTATQRNGARAMVERGIARGDVAAGWKPENVVTMLAAPTMFRAIIEEAPPDQSLVDDIAAVIVSAVSRPPQALS